MSEMLMGVPKKLNTLLARLSAAWAAKLDTLETRLSAAWAAKLDTLETRLSAAWAAKLDRLNGAPVGIPIAGGLNAGCGSTGTVLTDDVTQVMRLPLPYGIAVNTTTSWTDAINYTGAGFLECVLGKQSKDGANADSMAFEVIIDGATAYTSGTIACTLTQAAWHVGVGHVDSSPTGTDNYSVLPTLVPFRSSIQIRFRKVAAAGSSAAAVFYRLRKTT